MRVNPNISAHTLSLFGIAPSVQSEAKSVASALLSGAASRHVPELPAMDGIYTDPRAGSSSRPSLAQRAMDALKETLATDGAAFKKQAVARLEDALGRELEDGETFESLGSCTRSELPKDVLKMNRSAELMSFTLNAAMSQASEINLERAFALRVVGDEKLVDKPEGLRGLDMSKAEDRQRAVDFAIKLQTSINMAGIQMAQQDEVVSKMMTKSLEAAGATNLDDLKKSYAEFHRARFESGALSVVFDGVTITNDLV